jgi:hypothetical protein
MRPSSGVIVFVTAAKWCSGVSVVEGTAWVAVVWKRVVAEGVTRLTRCNVSSLKMIETCRSVLSVLM